MGGAETSLYYLVSNLDKSAYSPIIICPEFGSLVERLSAHDIHAEVIHLPAWRKLKSFLSRSISLQNLTEIVNEKNADLIHCNTIWVNHYAQKIGRKLNVPVICHLRDIIKKEQVRKYALDKVDMIIPISDAVKIPLDDAGISNDKIYMVYNGVDVSLFANGKSVIKKEYGIDGYLVGIVGQLNPRSQWKGQRDFIYAAAEISNQRKDVWFAIIGDDDTPTTDSNHGSYIKELKELTHNLGIERVIFTGRRNDMLDVMASLDILVSASWAEPFGRVIIEAMAAGKPVIATMAGGAPEIVQDNITGILVPPKDPQAIAGAISRMLQDENIMGSMGRLGQLRAEQLFSINRNVREIQSIYERFRVLW
jgi:glycosyltransferase involved in cell wall biosynthesis